MKLKKAESCETVEEIYELLKQLDKEKRLIRSQEELIQVEQEILSYTNRLAALILKKKSKPA
nr:hypothetical protein [uncultured Desulfobacter sp.]